MSPTPALRRGWRPRRARRYEVYGLRFCSTIPIPGRVPAKAGRADAHIVRRPASFFSRVRRALAAPPDPASWFGHARLADGSDYVRWSGLFEFLIAPGGGRIACRPLAGARSAAFRDYLLSQVLSFALLKRGIEPLHATTVVVGGQAVAFVGDCGAGKSTLAAAFLAAGHTLLTDDLLVLKTETGRVIAYPGPPRLKLFPEVARRLLAPGARGTPMNRLTPKLILPLNGRAARQAAPLKAIYLLTPPACGRPVKTIRVRPLSPRRAFVGLLRNTFNALVVDAERLERQLDQTARLVDRVPVKSLSFPRALSMLPSVRAAIESDLVA